MASIFLLFAEPKIIKKPLVFIVFSWFRTSKNRCEIAKHLFIEMNGPRTQILSKSIDFWIPMGPPWGPYGVPNRLIHVFFWKNAMFFAAPGLFFATCFFEAFWAPPCRVLGASFHDLDWIFNVLGTHFTWFKLIFHGFRDHILVCLGIFGTPFPPN